MKYILVLLILLFVFYSVPCFAYVYNPGNNPNNYLFRGSSGNNQSHNYIYTEKEHKQFHYFAYVSKWLFIILVLIFLLFSIFIFKEWKLKLIDAKIFIPLIILIFIVGAIVISLKR